MFIEKKLSKNRKKFIEKTLAKKNYRKKKY